jgi:hypothetical protein
LYETEFAGRHAVTGGNDFDGLRGWRLRSSSRTAAAAIWSDGLRAGTGLCLGRRVLRPARIGVGLGSGSLAASAAPRSDVGCAGLASGRPQLAIPSRILAIAEVGWAHGLPRPGSRRLLGRHLSRRELVFAPVPNLQSQPLFPHISLKTIAKPLNRFFPSCILKPRRSRLTRMRRSRAESRSVGLDIPGCQTTPVPKTDSCLRLLQRPDSLIRTPSAESPGQWPPGSSRKFREDST